MVSFSLSKSVAVVGERIDANCDNIDTSKGFYVCVVSNYNNSLDEYTLAQQQNILGSGNKPTSGSVTGQGMRVYITSENYDKINSLTIFYFNYYNNTDYSDVNDFENRVTLGDYTEKSQTFNVSLYNGKKLTGIVTWLRNWFNTKEEYDEIFFTDSDWHPCDYNTGYVAYTSGTRLRVRKVGKLVQINGVVKNTSALSGSAGTFATIPYGYRPHHNINHICQGSDMNKWALVVTPGGDMKIFRYGADNLANPDSGTWFPYTLTYFMD